ncbi:MAG: RraA family protein [Acidobacteria bacterium]|nr:RraA family protein [Acidobacteriota bacterium]
MSSSIRAIYPQLPPIAGYATTATFRSAFPGAEKEVYKRIGEHVESMQVIPEPRVSVIQNLDDPPSGAVLGEVMSRLYRRFGCAGIVTNGTARDLLQVEKLKLPVFASGLVVSHAYPHFVEIHVPVHIAGLTVRPGDLLHADANGVVLIPPEIAEHVAAACADFCDAENIVMNYLERPDVTVEKYREVHAQTAKAIADLGERLRKKQEQAQ